MGFLFFRKKEKKKKLKEIDAVWGVWLLLYAKLVFYSSIGILSHSGKESKGEWALEKQIDSEKYQYEEKNVDLN